MRTHIHTKIYGIKRSAKGWSEFYEFYFNKDKAIKRCRELQNWSDQGNHKQNFRVQDLNCEDSIIFTTSED